MLLGTYEGYAGKAHYIDAEGNPLCGRHSTKQLEILPEHEAIYWNDMCEVCLLRNGELTALRLLVPPAIGEKLAANEGDGHAMIRRIVAVRWLEVLCNSMESDQAWVDAFKAGIGPRNA